MKSIFNTVVAWRYDSVYPFSDDPTIQYQIKSLYGGLTLFEVRPEKFDTLLKMQKNVIFNYVFGQDN